MIDWYHWAPIVGAAGGALAAGLLTAFAGEVGEFAKAVLGY